MAPKKPTVSAQDILPPGTLVGDYSITKKIGRGGFSLIYLATEEDSGDEVVIKEYLPKKLARRDAFMHVVPLDDKNEERLYRGQKLFFQEAKTLTSLRHPNIVKVLGFFLANKTAYMVMRYERGKNLGTYVHARKGGLSTRFIVQIFLPILDALSLVHSRSLLHLDVKPGNIHLRHGNDPLLLDFGAVHSLSRGRTPHGQVITAGYSPVEQYYRGGQIGPWTDVYAVGASIRTCMEGRPPPPSVERHSGNPMKPIQEVMPERYPQFLLEAVDWAMEMSPTARPKDAGELLRALQKYTDDLPSSRLSGTGGEDSLSQLPMTETTQNTQ